ncbi:MAG: sugar phosphate isomerase/epimerase [Anaerolineae bacterium]|nr:sugar phosphate isomerase/epimerase [Anaerolineae bacterium]
MKFGICGFLTGKNEDGAEFPFFAAARQAGFDYVELPLSAVAAQSDVEFKQTLRSLDAAGIPCAACNVFFPGTLPLTGPAADPKAISDYLDLALERAARLDARTIVFGSGAARRVPDGYPLEQAWAQLVQMLRIAGEMAARHRITIAIEHLNQGETNIINSAAEAYSLAKLVNHPNVRLLLDIYHLYREQEDYGIAVTAKDWLAHAHFAEPVERLYPLVEDEPGRAFFTQLKKAGYDRQISLEAGYTHFQEQAPRALAVMRSLSA